MKIIESENEPKLVWASMLPVGSVVHTWGRYWITVRKNTYFRAGWTTPVVLLGLDVDDSISEDLMVELIKGAFVVEHEQG